MGETPFERNLSNWESNLSMQPWKDCTFSKLEWCLNTGAWEVRTISFQSPTSSTDDGNWEEINREVAQSVHIDLEMEWTNNIVNTSCNLIFARFFPTALMSFADTKTSFGQAKKGRECSGLKRHWMNGWRSAVGAFGLRIFMMGWHILFTVRLFWHLPLTRAAYKAVRKAANTFTECPVFVHDSRYKAKSRLHM